LLDPRGDTFRRLRFHISPQPSHRQYVDASTFSLVDAIFDDPQNGHDTGGKNSSPTAVFMLRVLRSVAQVGLSARTL